MANNKPDWSILRGSLILFVVCVLASTAMLAGSFQFRQKMEREYQSNHSRFRNASQQYLAVDEEERIIEEFYPEFVRLYRAGLLGGERRLSWLETLREAGDAIKIPELTYKIEAQRPTKTDFDVRLGSYELYSSPMNLSIGLLHEGDLFQLLNALDRDALGQYSVRSCNFKMTEGEIKLDPHVANIKADCLLDWLTIDLSGEERLTL
ncbi:MAG: hypothetical protein O7G83_13870 [Proteobacteria bacterium]|nr:hypothetical protein [Pseudomonadota bacterium]MCZ6894406.1 hypothetical protein [Gammaproteobacteria bacterium]